MPKIHQVNVKSRVDGERGLPKRAVNSVFVNYRGLEGDFNTYRTERKGSSLDMAVLLLPVETILQLNIEGWTVRPGDLGENITTSGIPYSDFNVGDRFRLGTHAQIEISEPCYPCKNLKNLSYVGEERVTEFISALFSKRDGVIVQPNRRGWYARVLQEGFITKGSLIERV